MQVFYLIYFIFLYLCMKESKAVLSAQVEKDAIKQLKAICEHEKRSQAKELEIIIDEKFKSLGLDKK
jgi:hypothetical protein